MQLVDVTPRVWERLLAIRYNNSCACCGNWSDSERAALDLYGPLARRDLAPLRIGQIGQSIDGRIATASGEVGKVSGSDGLEHLHRMRALVDGVVIGVKTALHDAPRLTVRLCEGESPARIVIDPSGRLPDDSPVFRDDGVRRLVIQSVPSKRLNGVEVIRLPATDGQIDPALIIEALLGAGLPNLLIEGGNFTIAKFIEAGLLSRLHIAVAPIVIGSGPLGLTISHDSRNNGDFFGATTSTYSLGSEVVYDIGFGPEAPEANKPVHG